MDYFKSKSEKYKWGQCKGVSFKFKHIWKIDQFKEKLKDKVEKIKSPKFSFPGLDIEFQLKFYPRGKEGYSDKNVSSLYLSCYLGCSIGCDGDIQYVLDLIGTDGKAKGLNSLLENHLDDTYYTFGIDNFVSSEYVVDPQSKVLQTNGQLYVSLKASVFYYKVSKFRLSQLALLESRDHSDFTIVVEDTEIPVHKAILANHSPVFKAMFSHDDTKEAREKKVLIPDVETHVMMDFLKYIYSGLAPKCGRLSLELLTLAEIYQVDELKTHCEEALSGKVSIKNVTDYLFFADLHSAELLKCKCMTFLASNVCLLICSCYEDYERLRFSRGKLSSEVTNALAEVLSSIKRPLDTDSSSEYSDSDLDLDLESDSNSD